MVKTAAAKALPQPLSQPSSLPPFAANIMFIVGRVRRSGWQEQCPRHDYRQLRHRRGVRPRNLRRPRRDSKWPGCRQLFHRERVRVPQRQRHRIRWPGRGYRRRRFHRQLLGHGDQRPGGWHRSRRQRQQRDVGRVGNATAGVTGKTTSQLQTPTGYTGIYADWDNDLDNADGDDDTGTGADDFWDFGGDSDYPLNKADFNGDGTATWFEFGQRRMKWDGGFTESSADDGRSRAASP